jgi:hypothetical protein
MHHIERISLEDVRMRNKLFVGAWVRSYSPGVWQIYRVLRGFYALRYSLAERKVRSRQVFVFSKRLLSQKWKRAFGSGSCDSSYVKPLSASDMKRLDRLLLADPGLASAFDDYEPAPVDLIVNLSMGVPQRSRLRSFCNNVLQSKLRRGIDHDQILRHLEQADLAQVIGKMPITATLQLTSRDHETCNREFIFRDCRVLPF